MTQDSDDLLAQVFAGIPAPTQEYNESSTYEVKTTHVENGHTTHTESHSYEVLEYTSERNDDVSEMVRRSSHEFQHFLDNTGIIGNTEEKDHSESHHEESHLETHHEEHHHEDHSVSGADEGHHQYDTVPTLNYVPDFEDQQHEMTENQNHLHEDQQSTVSSVRSAVSDATSVSVHSSVSQKSAQEYQVQQTVFVEEKQDDAHSVSTVKSSHHSSQHSHVSEKTIGSSSASTTSQATTINKYGVNAVADNTSEPSTPIAVQKSSQHDALIEQFKNLHPKEPSVVSSVAPSVPVPVSEDYSSDEEDRVMTVTYTQYAFDSDNVEQKKTVVPEHEDHVSHVEHHEEHHQSSDFDGLSNGFHHAVTDHNQQVFTRQDSDESMHFETAEYVSEEHHSTEEHHQETHHHKFNESSYGHTTEPIETIHYQHEQETIPVFHHTNTQHVHVPPASHAPPPPMSSSDSSSDDDTLLDEHVHHNHHHHHHETHEDSRGLVPNVVGPRVRDELRPVSLSNNARETHHHSTSRTTQHAPVAHVTPVSHVVDHSEKSSAKLDHREHLTPIIDPSAFIRKTSTHHEEVIHHSKFEREEEQESNYGHSDEKITHDRHHEHHEEGHGEVHHHHHHREPEREDEVFNGPSVKDLRSRFDNGVPVDVGYNLHKIHHHSTIITESRAPAVHEHHEVEVHSHHEKDEHHEHHHTAENEHTSEVEEQLVRQLLETEKEQHKEHKEHHHHHHHKEHKEHHHHHHHEHKRESVAHSELNHGNDSHHHVMSYEELTGSHPKGHQEQKVHHQESDSAEEQRAVADILSMFGGGARLRRPDHVEDLRIHQRTQSVRSSIDVQPQEHQYETKSRTVTESTVTRSRGNTAQSVQRSHAPTLIQIHDHQETTAPAAPVAATRHSSNDQFQSVRVVKNVRKFVSQWGQKDFVPPSSPVITVPRLSASPSPRGNFEHVFPQPTSRKSTVTSQVSHKTNTTVSQNHHHEEPIKRDSVCSISTTTTVHSEAPRSVVVEHEYSPAPVSDDDSESYCIQPLSARRMMFERGSRGYSINRKTHGELRPMVNVLED